MDSSAAQKTGLPVDWEVRHSRSKNLPYYFNTITKDSQWEPPIDTDTEVLKTYMAHHHSAPAASQPQPSQSDLGAEGGSTEGKIRAAHLLVKHRNSRRPSSWKEANITREESEAKDIMAEYERRIRAGETTLGDLALTESDCSSARKRGDLGFFGRGDMQKEFEDSAFHLKLGEMSGIVSTASGIHLIQRIE